MIFHAMIITKFNSLDLREDLQGETKPAAYLTLEIMLFVLVDGWSLLMGSLASSFAMP
jgi:hypothetical protein